MMHVIARRAPDLIRGLCRSVSRGPGTADTLPPTIHLWTYALCTACVRNVPHPFPCVTPPYFPLMRYLILILFLASPLAAQEIETDLELVLLADASGSIDADEAVPTRLHGHAQAVLVPVADRPFTRCGHGLNRGGCRRHGAARARLAGFDGFGRCGDSPRAAARARSGASCGRDAGAG